MDNLKYILILVLSLSGIINIIKSVLLCLCNDSYVRCKIILPIDDSCENPETLIRSMVLRHEWSDKKRYSEIYCVYSGNNNESMEICRRVCEDYPSARYIDKNNFEKSDFFDE